jgi:hypothetical protein
MKVVEVTLMLGQAAMGPTRTQSHVLVGLDTLSTSTVTH